MPDVIPGVEVVVVDEPALGPGAPTDTSTAFLLTADAGAPAAPALITSPAQMRIDHPSATTMWGEVDAIIGEGRTVLGAPKVWAVKIASGASGLANTLALLPRSKGPGQVGAPSIVTATDIALIDEWAWDSNRVYFANGPAAAADSALITLWDTIKSSGSRRNTALFADVAIIPGVGATTREVPWALVEMGLAARNDLNTGNPNLAAAGDQGVCVYTLGIKAERTDAAMTTLEAEQINVARAPYGGAARGYGWQTGADLDLHPQWWDIGGSRVVMDVRANAAATSDHVLFQQIDGEGNLIAKWNGMLSKRLLELKRAGALFANSEDIGFRVDTGANFNPLENLALGRLRAGIRLKTSPHVKAIDISLTRLPITAAA